MKAKIDGDDKGHTNICCACVCVCMESIYGTILLYLFGMVVI